METRSYYFWKWADNDLPGNPREVYSALLRGRLHPALQHFDARPLLRELKRIATRGRKIGQEWDWQVCPANDKTKALFVFVNGPAFDASREYLRKHKKILLPLGLSGYDESNDDLIEWLLPKLNYIYTGQDPFPRLYDVTVKDVPRLIKSVNHKSENPFGILVDARNHFVQFLACGRRCIVEWRENHDLSDPTKFDHWRAMDTKRLAATDRKPPYKGMPVSKVPDHVCYTDAVKIFQAFLKNEPRPEDYTWRNINSEIEWPT